MSYSDENVDDFFSTVNIDPALRTLLNGDAPVWLSLLKKGDADNKHPLVQMKEGLNWAQTLGDAARNGFKVIYTPINKKTWYESSISYYTTLLHKRIIGQTVFDTKIFTGNRYDTHFYAHCNYDTFYINRKIHLEFLKFQFIYCYPIRYQEHERIVFNFRCKCG